MTCSGLTNLITTIKIIKMSEIQQKTTHVPVEFVAMMAMLMSVVALSIDTMLPALGIMGADLAAAHPNEAQYIISSIFLGMAIGEFLSGVVSDSFGRKRVLYTGLAIYLVGSLICFFSQTMTEMLVGRFIQGLGVSAPYVVSIAIIRDKFSGRPMAKVMSLVMMVFIMIPVVAPAIGQAITMAATWRYIFSLGIVYALMAALWVGLRLEETLPKAKRTKLCIPTFMRNLRTIFTNRKVVCYMLCMGCIFGALIGDLNSAPQIFQGKYGVGEMFVVYFGLQALAFGLSSLLNSVFVERLGMRYISIRAVAMMTVMSLAMVALSYTMEIGFWLFFSYGTVLLFCVGVLFGNLNALALEPLGEMAGMAASVISGIYLVIAMILGTIIGQMYDGTLLPVLLGFSVLGVAAWLLLAIADKEVKAL